MGRLLELLPEDVEYLDANYRGVWHMLREGSGKYGLLIENFDIPVGFERLEADLMVLIPVSYPASPLDMFYLDPPLTRPNGAYMEALSVESHFARRWQRWSRHYRWKPGEDDLARHIGYIWNELQVAASK